jgi:uncharacterized protein with PQ loop repeat
MWSCRRLWYDLSVVAFDEPTIDALMLSNPYLCIVLDDVHSEYSDWIARASGVIALVLTVFIWTPQLVHTYRAKVSSSVSIDPQCPRYIISTLFPFCRSINVDCWCIINTNAYLTSAWCCYVCVLSGTNHPFV